MGAGAVPCLLDCAFFAPAVYLVLRVTEAAENLIGMLPELRRERSDRAGRIRQLYRHAYLLDLLPIRCRNLDDHVARQHLRIVRHFVEREHPPRADIGLAKYLEP